MTTYGTSVGSQVTWSRAKKLGFVMFVILIILTFKVYYTTVLGNQTFYQPRNALTAYSDDYAAAYDKFGECISVHGQECPNATIELLLERREAALQRDWPIILEKLSDLDNWRKAPHAIEAVPNTWTATTRNFPDYEIFFRFAGLIEEAGGIQTAAKCTPVVLWDSTGTSFWHEFTGLSCGGVEHKMRRW